MIWHIIWNNTIYGCGIYECILLYTIRIWYGTVIEDILGIYKPTIFNIGEIETAIYIWYVKVVGIRSGDFYQEKRLKHYGRYDHQCVSETGVYPVYIYTHMVILMPGNSWLKIGFRGSLFSNIPTWCFPETKLLIK